MNDPWLQRVRSALGVEDLGEDGPRAVADVDAKDWHEAVRACRDEIGCDFFDWLSAVDEGPEGFRIVAHLWSVAGRRGVLLRAMLTEGAVDSVVDLYPGADWHERETHEMFGVDFPGHPGLEPLLLAPEFEGHPLRKDFVLASRVVKPWPGAKEPGEGHGTARKRAPKRPPGVPENWLEPEAAQAEAPTADGTVPREPRTERPRKAATARPARPQEGRASAATDGDAGSPAEADGTAPGAPEGPGPDAA
ncbi:NADH-quinone oxidoreductase subunit C [Glycomyces paridis]|uniref:NADH-quinone oxidoreductase subunit C n=1 Tax=Glycomyces paridis TaxID=2126555 RepID=A0A4S8PBA0_9ACTN|nr:NADH-quinone oxidoreductase subunit C [Glycomyces paridis]THV27588.1 NADH-quinone oxidoreductase subunit C [Glycomyces paridis]